jgi:hypothetical protein
VCTVYLQYLYIISQKEQYFPPPVYTIEHGEVEVGNDSVPGFNIDIHATKNRRFHARALWEPDAKEVVP